MCNFKWNICKTIIIKIIITLSKYLKTRAHIILNHFKKFLFHTWCSIQDNWNSHSIVCSANSNGSCLVWLRIVFQDHMQHLIHVWNRIYTVACYFNGRPQRKAEKGDILRVAAILNFLKSKTTSGQNTMGKCKRQINHSPLSKMGVITGRILTKSGRSLILFPYLLFSLLHWCREKFKKRTNIISYLPKLQGRWENVEEMPNCTDALISRVKAGENPANCLFPQIFPKVKQIFSNRKKAVFLPFHNLNKEIKWKRKPQAFPSLNIKQMSAWGSVSQKDQVFSAGELTGKLKICF